jgi:hypothetical protein
MAKLWSALAVVLVAGAAVGLRPAQAAPPTVTPSPGYDARLQEQRRALSASSPSVARRAAPLTANGTRHHKRKHGR